MLTGTLGAPSIANMLSELEKVPLEAVMKLLKLAKEHVEEGSLFNATLPFNQL